MYIMPILLFLCIFSVLMLVKKNSNHSVTYLDTWNYLYLKVFSWAPYPYDESSLVLRRYPESWSFYFNFQLLRNNCHEEASPSELLFYIPRKCSAEDAFSRWLLIVTSSYIYTMAYGYKKYKLICNLRCPVSLRNFPYRGGYGRNLQFSLF